MKTFLLILALANFAACYEILSEQEERKLFRKHILKYNITSIKSEEMEDYRARFIRNLYRSKDHNEQYEMGNSTYKQFVCRRCYLPYDEFVKRRGGIIEGPTPRALQIAPVCRTKPIPSSFNWVEQGVVTPVQDQKSCGSCYIFLALAAVESHIAIKYGKLVKLSEQDILDCAKYPYKSDEGCDGGVDSWLYTYLKKVGGATMGFNYPYENTDQKTCDLGRPKVPESKVVDFVALTPYDEENMKYHLATVGPIAVSVWMSPSFMRYQSGIYEDTKFECSGRGLNHGMLIVGYGSAPCNGRVSCDYWLIKNSWGTQWGEKGYVRWMRNNRNMCNIARSPKYPIV